MSYHGLGTDPAGPLVPGAEYKSETTVPSICPPCAFLDQGSCRWCPDNDATIPGCELCVDHKMPPEPWYKQSSVVVPMMVAVGTTVVASLVTALVMHRMHVR